ncbi:hypothetical protein CP533_3162 [Ophiocordyceps camponoti-saundersi (nom. inval.)]|nr:hypothetical protein CP533_3162 [Ophiocordyceps camponoti-saundersi (nom. inval.)]
MLSSLSLLVSSLLLGSVTAQDGAAQIITSCTQPDTFALTFDDGPHVYTAKLLNTLRAAGAKATFFVNGQNLGQIENYGDLLKQMLCDGHQIASHTFSHKDLATLSEADITKEMTDLEEKLLQDNSIGLKPTYMRPPYFNTNDLVLKVMGKLGYKVIHASVDTKDYQFTSEATNGQAVSQFEQGVNSGGTIALMHDIHSTTVDLLVPKALEILKKKNKKAVTVGECLGDAKSNWYSGGKGSINGSCGQKRGSDENGEISEGSDGKGRKEDDGKERKEDARKTVPEPNRRGYAGKNASAEPSSETSSEPCAEPTAEPAAEQ